MYEVTYTGVEVLFQEDFNKMYQICSEGNKGYLRLGVDLKHKTYFIYNNIKYVLNVLHVPKNAEKVKLDRSCSINIYKYGKNYTVSKLHADDPEEVLLTLDSYEAFISFGKSLLNKKIYYTYVQYFGASSFRMRTRKALILKIYTDNSIKPTKKN